MSQYWIWVDGKVNTEWVENLNSVLDDNRIYTLPNGERFSLEIGVHLIFEDVDLNDASPATVSRLGILNLRDPVQRNLGEKSKELSVVDFCAEMSGISKDSDSFLRKLEFSKSMGLHLFACFEQMEKSEIENYILMLTEEEKKRFQKKETIEEVIQFVDQENKKQKERLKRRLQLNELQDSMGKPSTLKQEILSEIIGEINGKKTSEPEPSLKREAASVVFFACNCRTTSLDLWNLIRQNTNIVNGVLRPKESKRLFIVISEVLLAEKDGYKVSSLQESLRTIASENCVYIPLEDPSLKSSGVDTKVKFIGIKFILLFEKNRLNEDSRMERLFSSFRLVDLNNREWERRMKSFDSSNFMSKQKRFSKYLEQNDADFLTRNNNFDQLPVDLISDFVRTSKVKYESCVSRKQSVSLKLIFEKICKLESSSKLNLSGTHDDIVSFHLLRLLQLFRLSQLENRADSSWIKNMVIVYPRGFPMKRIFEIVSIYFDYRVLDVSTSSLKKRNSNFSLKNVILFHIQQIVPSILETEDDVLTFKGLFLILRQKHFGNISLLAELDNLSAIGLLAFLSGGLQKVLEKAGFSGLSKSKMERIYSFIKHKIKVVTFVWSSAYESVSEDVQKNFPSLSHHFQLIRVQTDDSLQIEKYNHQIIKKSIEIFRNSLQLSENAYLLNLEEMETLSLKDSVDISSETFHIFSFLKASQKMATKEIKKFIRNFLFLKKYKLERIDREFEKYHAGFRKIEETNSQIQSLKKTLDSKKKVLEQQEKQLEKESEGIKRAEKGVKAERKKALKLKEFLEEEESQVSEKRSIVQSKLSKVQPLIEQAKKDVRSINKAYLDELRRYKMIPTQVVHIFEALMKLQGKLDTSLSNMRKFLGQRSVIDSITSLNPRAVSRKTLESIRKLLLSKPNSFDAAKVAKLSKAAAPFCGFIKAVVKLVETCHEVKPLEDELAQVDKKLEDFKWELQENERNIKKLEVEKQNLESSFQKNEKNLIELRESLGRDGFNQSHQGESGQQGNDSFGQSFRRASQMEGQSGQYRDFKE